MAHYVRKHYKPAELKLAIEALQKNGYHDFAESEAKGIIAALYHMGFRIVKVSE